MASVDVPDGTSFAYAIAEGSITSTPILRTSLAPTAVTDPAVLEGTVADGVLRAGQLVVSGTFVAPEDVGRGSGPATFADALPAATVAVSFDPAGPSALSNMITPGDRVNLLVNAPNASVPRLPAPTGPAVLPS